MLTDITILNKYILPGRRFKLNVDVCMDQPVVIREVDFVSLWSVFSCQQAICH